MVLQANFAKRTDLENAPPPTHPKSLAARLHSSINDTSRRRRLRSSGVSKYAVEQAKRRNANRPRASSIVRFNFTAVPTSPDVEMNDAVSGPRSTPISFPRKLGRPAFKEVSLEALKAVDPSLVDTDIYHIRESLQEMGSDLLKSLASVRAYTRTRDKLPKELEIVTNDMTVIPPSHMLAVFGKAVAGKPHLPRKVTLYPAHSLVLASQCAHLPESPSPITPPEEGAQKLNVPVWPLCLPSPLTYPHLSTYLYSKRLDIFVRSVLPRPPPPTYLQNPSQVSGFPRELAETFTVQTLIKHVFMIYGVWQNVCALGIFDDNLWETLDILWELLLTSIAIGTGNLSAMTTA